VARLQLESKILNDQILAKKGVMGMNIYDAFEKDDQLSAEV
jgi:hypothetical protein